MLQLKLSSSSKQAFKVRITIGWEGHDFEADFSIVSRKTFENTFASEQLEYCILPAAAVVTGQLSKSGRNLLCCQ